MAGVLNVDEDGTLSRHEFHRRVVIGRDFDCDVILTNRSVSRKHAILEHGPGGWILRDLKSVNGTFVKGARVKKDIILGTGEALLFGDVKAVFEILPEVELSGPAKLLQTISVAPTKKARPVAALVAAGACVLVLVAVTLREKGCLRKAPPAAYAAPAPQPAKT
jgi:pSer/pThr/pTyr-binding forkhead associated (FHA) protein